MNIPGSIENYARGQLVLAAHAFLTAFRDPSFNDHALRYLTHEFRRLLGNATQVFGAADSPTELQQVALAVVFVAEGYLPTPYEG